MADNTGKNNKIELVSLVKRLIDNKLLDAHVSIPSKITAIDHDTMTVCVKPLVKRPERDGSAIDMPVINNVPVSFWQNSTSFIYFPLKVDDIVMLAFTDYSLDDWLVAGGDLNPRDIRNHNISDAVIIGCLAPFGSSVKPNLPTNIEFKNDKITIEMRADGKLKISGASNELISVLSEWMTEVIDAKVDVNTVVTNAVPLVAILPVTGADGAAPFNAATKSTLNGVKTKLDTFKT